jgi:hypothetical protein
MTTIKINQMSVVTFDGEVIEKFPDRRIHIGMLVEFALVRDKQGKYKLNVRDLLTSGEWNIDDEAVPKVTKLVAQVQKAKSEFKFD